MKKVLILIVAICSTIVVSCKKEGCTDSIALNYSSSAKKNDGSCFYETDVSSPDVIKYDYTMWVFEFTGSNGNYSNSISLPEVTENDALIFELKCGVCSSFELLPKTYDDQISFGIIRSGSNINFNVILYNPSNTLYTDPFYDIVSQSTLRVYVIKSKSLIDAGIDKNDLEEIQKHFLS